MKENYQQPQVEVMLVTIGGNAILTASPSGITSEDFTYKEGAWK